MMRQPGFFDVEERLAALSTKGDSLEKLGRLSRHSLVAQRMSA